MNNKGFAITGILYTLFVLFVMILLSILATISYKKGILEKTILGLEEAFKTTKVEENLNTTYITDTSTNITTTTINGKYEFVVNTKVDGAPHYLKCSVYLEKGQTIPNKIEANNTSPDFTLIPSDCNKYSYEISLDTTSTEQNKLILANVYEFKGQ